MTPEEEQKVRMLIELLRKNGDYSPTQPTRPSYAPPEQQQADSGMSPSTAMRFMPQEGAATAGAGQVGGGGLSTAGRANSLTGMGSSGSSGGMGVGGYAAAAAAMAALVKGGNKLNIGANNQAKWYHRMISDSNEEKLKKLLPWEWF